MSGLLIEAALVIYTVIAMEKEWDFFESILGGAGLFVGMVGVLYLTSVS